MRYYRCKCGNSCAWTTMGVERCVRCPKCGSDLAEGPDGHDEPAPHEFVTRYSETTGAPYEVCLRCLRRRSELPAVEGGTDAAPPSVPTVTR